MSPWKLCSSMIREAQRCSCGRTFFCGAVAFPGELRANKCGDLARRWFLFCVVIFNYCCVSSGVVDARSLMQAASSARRSQYNNADSTLPRSSSSSSSSSNSLFRETVASVQGGGGAVSFMQNYETTADANHYRMLDGGQLVQLVLDPEGASGFASKNKYLFGFIELQIKLVPGNSAGTVTAYYMASDTVQHDEIDFEFLGNVSGQPYSLQTNVYASGTGDREQRINLWFDPTADFHSYSVLWNKQQIIFLVDQTPIRVYMNSEDIGVPYLNQQPMGVYSSIWNGDQWATQGGSVKLDWTMAPFVASYQGFSIDACQVQNANTTPCIANTSNWWEYVDYQMLASRQINDLTWVRDNWLTYNYCADRRRFKTQAPECARNPL